MTTDIVRYLRPTTLVEVIYDLQPYINSYGCYGELISLLNAAVCELINNAGEADARTMLAEKGLVLMVSFTVQQV